MKFSQRYLSEKVALALSNVFAGYRHQILYTFTDFQVSERLQYWGPEFSHNYLIDYLYIPYLLDQIPRLLFISLPEFVRGLFESDDYLRAVFINTSIAARDAILRETVVVTTD